MSFDRIGDGGSFDRIDKINRVGMRGLDYPQFLTHKIDRTQ